MPVARSQAPLDRAARQWVDSTIKKLSLEQLVGQMIFAPFQSTYLSSDSDDYDALVKLIHESHIGGVIAFGGAERVPQVMLNPTYGAVILGQPLELASMLNRLQSISALPLLTSSDFEWGVQMRIAGATKFPRAMAFGAAGDPQLAYEAGKVVGHRESRALGVHVNFAPVADVNNNPRNPVINIRSFGEDPTQAGAMVAGWVRGLQEAGMLATLKHFPGHGDTDVDSHLGLPVIPHPRERLDAVELPPFKAGIAAGAAGVMVAHIELPAIDPEKQPATFSPDGDQHAAAAGFRRADLLRLDEDGGDHADGAARRRRGERREGRHRRDSRFTGFRRGGGGDRRRGEGGRHPARAGRRVGAPHPRSQGAAGFASRAHDQPRGGAALGRRPQARCGGAGGERARDHARQGRAQQRAAVAAADRSACCICRCSTIRRAGASPRRAAR